MIRKSAAIVGFIANLLPLYVGECHGELWCARSMHDGTLILPIESADAADNGDEGWVSIHWQGDHLRHTEVLGQWIATLAIDRYVRLHGAGASEDAIAAELWFMAEHFRYKTGCHIDISELKEPSHPAVRAAKRIGEGVLVNAVSRLMGT